MANSAVQKDKKQQERRKVADLKIVGGTDGIPPNSNWLVNLPLGAVFVTKPRVGSASYAQGNFMVLTLEIFRKTEKTVRLWDNLNDKFFGDVDPNRFVNVFELVEVLEQEQEGQDGNSDRIEGDGE